MTALGPSLYWSPIYYRIWKYGKILSQISLCPPGFQFQWRSPKSVTWMNIFFWLLKTWSHSNSTFVTMLVLFKKTRNNMIKLYKKESITLIPYQMRLHANKIKLLKSWDQRNSGSSYCESNHILHFSLDKKTKANPTLWQYGLWSFQGGGGVQNWKYFGLRIKKFR